jgi:hypothetical protein
MADQDSTQPYVKRRKRRTAAWIFFGVGGTGCAIMAIIAFLGQISGNFSIKLNEQDNAKIAMATETSFSDETSYLRAQGLVSADCITADNLPDDNLVDTETGGDKNGDNYFAYTFYIKNTSADKVSYNVAVNIDDYRNPSNQAVSLIAILRLRVFENLVTTPDAITHAMSTYAKGTSTPYTNSDGVTEYREPIAIHNTLSDGKVVFPEASGNMKAENLTYAEMFKSDSVAYDRVYSDLAPNNLVRYTVMMWLEGADPDCIGKEPKDSSVTFSMHFSAIQNV